MNKLIVTNGDSAAERIVEQGIANRVLPWRDVLHDGPVHKVDSLQTQSKERAVFIAEFAGQDVQDVFSEFKERDQLFLSSLGEKRLELWFEHDLYDQLQLMQILHTAYCDNKDAPVYLVQSLDFLAEMSNAAFQKLPDQAVLLSREEKEYAANAWQAFCDPSPQAVREFLRKPARLCVMHKALERLIAEYPDQKNGLPLSMQYALSIFETRKEASVKDMFLHMQTREEAKFMGDLSFAHRVNVLITDAQSFFAPKEEPLKYLDDCAYMDFFNQKMSLTASGEDLRRGTKKCEFYSFGLGWLGGVDMSSL